MVCLLSAIGMWATDEAPGKFGTKDTKYTGTCFSIDATYIAGSGSAQVAPMTTNGVKVRTNKNNNTLTINVNSGYEINDLIINGISNSKTEGAIASVTVDDGTTSVLSSAVTLPLSSASAAGTVSLKGINATKSIVLTFSGSATQANLEFIFSYTQKTVITYALQGVTLNGSAISDTDLATLKSNKTVTIDGSNFNGVGMLAATLSAGESTSDATVTRSYSEGNIVYAFKVNSDDYTVKVSNTAKTYTKVGKVIAYKEGTTAADGQNSNTISLNGVAFAMVNAEKAFQYGTGKVTLSGVDYQPIKLSTGSAVNVTFPEGYVATKVNVYGWSQSGNGSLYSFAESSEEGAKSVDVSKDIYYAGNEAIDSIPSVYTYTLDNWASAYFNAGGSASQPFVVMDFVLEKSAPTTYAITATTADATMGSASVSAASVEAGSSVIVTATATANAGYDFVNWTVGEEEVSTSASYEFTPTAATDLVANFKAHVYTVKFIADGSQYAHVNVLYGESINPNLQAPDKKGYTFKGWDPEIPAAIVADMTFNAIYEVNKYNLTFIVDGKETTYQVAYGALIPDYLPSDISKEGYTCTGWSPALAITMPAEDVTYTAQFTKNAVASDFALAATTATVETSATTTVSYTTSSTGAVSVSSNSENATVTVDQTTKTITISGVNAGEATITVSQAATDDYSASAEMQIAVTVTAPAVAEKTLKYKQNGSLTFAYDATASRDVYEFVGVYNNTVYGIATKSIVAGKPYIVTASDDDLVLTYENGTEASEATHYNGFYGVLDGTFTCKGEKYLVFYNGNICYANDGGTDVNSGHAYFFITEVPNDDSVSTGNAKALFTVDLDDFATSINSVTAALKSNTPVYNISGQRVSSVKNGGVYVVNGKKVVVK